MLLIQLFLHALSGKLLLIHQVSDAMSLPPGHLWCPLMHSPTPRNNNIGLSFHLCVPSHPILPQLKHLYYFVIACITHKTTSSAMAATMSVWAHSYISNI